MYISHSSRRLRPLSFSRLRAFPCLQVILLAGYFRAGFPLFFLIINVSPEVKKLLKREFAFLIFYLDCFVKCLRNAPKFIKSQGNVKIKKKNKNINAMHGQIQDLLVFSSVLFQHIILHRPYPLACQYRHSATPIFRLVCQPTYRLSVDMSTDKSAECRSICPRIYRSRGGQNTHYKLFINGGQ